MRRDGELDESEANSTYTLDDFYAQYQRQIISTVDLRRFLADIVPTEAVAELERRLRAVDALIKRRDGYVLVPDAGDRRRWLRQKASSATTV